MRKKAKYKRQGSPVEREPEITVDLPIDAHLPKDYVADEGLRLEAYRLVAQVRDARGVKAAKDELVDRYGPMPEPAERLLSVAALKAALRRWGITEVTTTPRRTVRISPVKLDESTQVRLARIDRSAQYNDSAGVLELRLPAKGDLVGWLAKRLKELWK